jgi:hypothetical protein
MQTPLTKAEVELGQGLYETDFYAWTQQQANLLRDRQWDEIDLSNLIEEIESLGRKERWELRNRLSILIGHLLKWEYQPTRRSHSWLATIRIQRRELLKLLSENPSLQSSIVEAISEAYENGRDLASGDTNLPLSVFPDRCSYLWSDLTCDRFPGEQE